MKTEEKGGNVEILIAVIVGWFWKKIIAANQIMLVAREYVYIATLYARENLRPMYWFLARRNLKLEYFLSILLEIIEKDGLYVRRPTIRKLLPGFTEMSNDLPVQALCYFKRRLILIGDEAATASAAVCLFVVGHELGHYLDHVTKRHGHPLFNLIGHEGSERFASSVSWYCLKYIQFQAEGRPFDWEEFERELPILLKDFGDGPEVAL